MDPRTRLQHPEKVIPAPDNQPLVSPIYQSVKYHARDMRFVRELFAGQKQGFLYGRVANPTTRELERMLAGLQGRDDAVCVASGMCAITTTLLALLEAGDHFIIFRESYKPTRVAANSILKKFGIKHTMLSLTDLTALEKTLKEQPTKLVLFESPTNPCLFVADINRMTSLARKYGAITVLDNTFSGFHNHGDTDVDLFLHSLTKFACGHSDAMGGAIIGNHELLKIVKFNSVHIGGTLDPNSAHLILRGMKTYLQRYRLQSDGALAVARWLNSCPAMTNVRYPGLPSHPQHDLAKVQQKDFGAVISFELKNSSQPIDTFIDRLKLFHLGGSVGSTESLVAPAALFFSGDLSSTDQQAAMITPHTVRISVGLEAPEDLIADLAQAAGLESSQDV